MPDSHWGASPPHVEYDFIGSLAVSNLAFETQAEGKQAAM